MPPIRFIILTGLIFGLTSGVLAGEEFSRPVRVVPSAIPAEGSTASSVEKVILDSMRLEFRLSGFDLFAAGTENQGAADYLTVAEYTIAGSDIAVTIRCLEAGRNREVATGSWRGRLTLDLDEAIQGVIRNEIVPVLPASISVNMREVEKAAGEGEKWALAIIAAGEPTGREPVAAVEITRWRTGVVGSVFFPLADTAEYAQIGYGGTLALNYVFHLGGVSISPGINLGAMFFSAEAANAADALFLPAGIEVRIGAAPDGPLRPWVRFAGGIAWFHLTPEVGSSQSKFVPYAEAGLGTDIFFGRTFGLTVEADFRVVFEGSVILYHVAPGIGAAFRF